ncbi:MAG: hypothetical protein IKL37_03465 [Alphaproteobacteria bacterium]|nr:hypothetical protein [Alphaproteobacteria bacterium]MBR6685299.1 hypothetical protein [Alphaproteobacteria bacterium]
MKKLLLVCGVATLGACSMLGDFGMEPKMVVNCQGVSPLTVTASEAKELIEALKQGDTSVAICVTHAKFCEAAVKVNVAKKCSIEPAL